MKILSNSDIGCQGLVIRAPETNTYLSTLNSLLRSISVHCESYSTFWVDCLLLALAPSALTTWVIGP